MALIQADFYSLTLSKITNFNIVLPNDIFPDMVAENENYHREMKTLYLLHGYSGNSKDWLFGSQIQELAVKYNLAVVMPSGDNSFYLDAKGTGRAYCQYIGKELIEYIRKTFGLSEKKENTYIGGNSMGGFGAIHTGLTFPNTFERIISLSSALIIPNIKNMQEDYKDEIADFYYYTSIFGDLKKIEQSINNPEYLIRKLKEQGERIPPIYMTCGTEDFLLEPNRSFHKFLCNEGIDVQYKESPGMHDWTYWNQHLEASIQWLLEG